MSRVICSLSTLSVMTFRQGRGRPKKPLRLQKDKGTQELQRKRKLAITAEPLDICLKLKLITPEQHWAGVHLRWLYSLRHGALTVKSCMMEKLVGQQTRLEHNTQWLAAREREYNAALRTLASLGYKKQVMNCAVFMQWPGFIVFTERGPRLAQGHAAQQELFRL